MPVVEHLEEYLATDVVGIIAGEHKRAAVEGVVEVHFQKVVLDDVVLKFRKVFA